MDSTKSKNPAEQENGEPGLNTLKKHYLDLAHRFCTPPDNPQSETEWLWELHSLLHGTVKLMAHLNEHTASGPKNIGNRHCIQFMIQESFSAPDRHQLVRTITSWIGLSVKLATLRNRTGTPARIRRAVERCPKIAVRLLRQSRNRVTSRDRSSYLTRAAGGQLERFRQRRYARQFHLPFIKPAVANDI